MQAKAIHLTTEVDGHTHSLDDTKNGTTSETNGHTHRYELQDSQITIFETHGHIHTATDKLAETKENKTNNNALEYKTITFPFEVIQKTIDDSDPDFFIFEGYASTFGNVDLGDDIVAPGAFTETLKSKPNFRILWQHRMHEPIGMPIMAREDSKGLFIRARLPKEDTLVRGRVMPQMRVGSITQMSIGFFIKRANRDDDGIRTLLEIDLFEVSLVTMAMNPEAEVTDFKSIVSYKELPLADRETPWDSDAAEKRVRAFTDAPEFPSAKYKNAFLWYDTANEENFTAYKLGFADVIDGQLKAIPRGIFAAAAALSGARGGVNIPASERPQVINNINRYYEKMTKEFNDDMTKEFNDDAFVSPFKKSISGITCMKEVEDILKNRAGLSNKERMLFISKIKEYSKASHDPVMSDPALVKKIKDLATYINTQNSATG